MSIFFQTTSKFIYRNVENTKIKNAIINKNFLLNKKSFNKDSNFDKSFKEASSELINTDSFKAKIVKNAFKQLRKSQLFKLRSKIGKLKALFFLYRKASNGSLQQRERFLRKGGRLFTNSLNKRPVFIFKFWSRALFLSFVRGKEINYFHTKLFKSKLKLSKIFLKQIAKAEKKGKSELKLLYLKQKYQIYKIFIKSLKLKQGIRKKIFVKYNKKVIRALSKIRQKKLHKRIDRHPFKLLFNFYKRRKRIKRRRNLLRLNKRRKVGTTNRIRVSYKKLLV